MTHGSDPPGRGDGGEPVLRASDLGLFIRNGHARLRIVSDVTFSIARGEVFALVGESGSGKTVLARSIMRLFAPGTLGIEGTLRFEGVDIARASDRTMRELRGNRIGMIFQEPMSSLNPLMTVGRQIGEAMLAHRPLSRTEARARIIDLLADVRFENPAQVSGMYPHELSGGMRQRVVIAMALANNPALVIADEPTTALDVTIQADIMEILMRLKERRRISVLLISHDLSLVQRYSDKAGVLYGGVLMETGPVRRVVGRPAHPYTRALLDCVPRARSGSERQSGIPGTVPRVDDWFDGCRFAPRCPRRGPGCDTGPIPITSVGDADEARCLYPL